MKNVLSWFEIPVSDMDRAVRFYEDVLSSNLRREVFFGTPLAIFGYEAPGAGGNVMQPKTAIGKDGFIALIRDSEGNTVGLHSAG